MRAGQKSKPMTERFLTQALIFDVESSWTRHTAGWSVAMRWLWYDYNMNITRLGF